ncbi:hypothetical protein A7U60_g4331 [Sanghuangporus baumii]|uniref:Uncharacterized protein n=1 Tax=Sanghuangporus baumii TaxID=108892 RepID=A0A9Q5N9A4_SANBA|nr:hypothetical protein A7U60_g4331 [Sanghuangporus baumii]
MPTRAAETSLREIRVSLLILTNPSSPTGMRELLVAGDGPSRETRHHGKEIAAATHVRMKGMREPPVAGDGLL